MSLIEAIGLGALQGITEFLPISSSGHLVLGQHLLGIEIPGNEFEVWVHIGTLLSILVVFRKEIGHLISSIFVPETSKYLGILFIASLPAVLVGLIFRDSIQAVFDKVSFVGLALIITAGFLFLTRIGKPAHIRITARVGLIIGMAQAFAILPGISRSGATIATAMIFGVQPEKAAQFSFFLAIPVITGAGLLTALDISQVNGSYLSFQLILAGLFSSFIIGWLSLRWLIDILKRGKFHWFGYYCLSAGIIVTII